MPLFRESYPGSIVEVKRGRPLTEYQPLPQGLLPAPACGRRKSPNTVERAPPESVVPIIPLRSAEANDRPIYMPMTPRFGGITQVLGGAFLVAGLGAAWSGLDGSHGADQLLLLALCVPFLAIGLGLWLEAPLAWWAGLTVAALTVVADLTLRLPDGGWPVWAVFVCLFACSAVQGFQDRHRAPGW
jgi:hypothetical protein